MPEPVSVAVLGVAIGKLLLRWSDLNDAADALEDAHAGYSVLRRMLAGKPNDPVTQAITGLLERRLPGVVDSDRRDQMGIAVLNVAKVFTGLSDHDIRRAAQDPQGFPEYLASGPGRQLLEQTEEALTPFARQLMGVGAGVFAELAPRSGRFTNAALLHLLDQVNSAGVVLAELHDGLAATRTELAAATSQFRQQVDGLQPKINRILTEVSVQNISPSDVVVAAVHATQCDASIGQRVDLWDAATLGIHESITVHDETTLTPYIPRSHDRQLRDILKKLRQDEGLGDGNGGLVLVVGNSCVGKSRALYEAARDVLPDWQLVTGASTGKLLQVLASGIPARTVVWLDELQKSLTTTAEGIAVATAVQGLMDSPDVGPILFVGTIWPDNLTTLVQRPTPLGSAAGMDAVRDLLHRAVSVTVADTFADTDLVNVPDDPRIRVAIDTATRHSEGGRRVTQTLAGGSQVIDRLYPNEGACPTGAYSPAARAVLQAVGDLFRVGLDERPLPAWSVEAAAAGYLDHPAPPGSNWFEAAISEVTRPFARDDPLTGNPTLDIHSEGVPPLTLSWATGPNDIPALTYKLHDYLLQDHLRRHRNSPIRMELWSTLMAQEFDASQAERLARSASERGLLSVAIHLLRPHVKPGTGLYDTDTEFNELLALRGADTDIAELRERAACGSDSALDSLIGLLPSTGERIGFDSPNYSDSPEHHEIESVLKRRRSHQYYGQTWDLTGMSFQEIQAAADAELRERADAGDGEARSALATWLVAKADAAALEELRERADAGDWEARSALATWLVSKGDAAALEELRERADAGDWEASSVLATWLVAKGDAAALEELRERATIGGDYHAENELTQMLLRLGSSEAVAELRELADHGAWPAQWELAQYLEGLGPPEGLNELRARADRGDWPSQRGLSNFLASSNSTADIEELRARAAGGESPAADALAEHLGRRQDDVGIRELKELVLSGVGGRALILAYRSLERYRTVRELDCNANPQYDD